MDNLTFDMGHKEYGISLCGSNCPYGFKYCNEGYEICEYDECPAIRDVVQKLGTIEHELPKRKEANKFTVSPLLKEQYSEFDKGYNACLADIEKLLNKIN